MIAGAGAVMNSRGSDSLNQSTGRARRSHGRDRPAARSNDRCA